MMLSTFRCDWSTWAPKHTVHMSHVYGAYSSMSASGICMALSFYTAPTT
jgi:hypothetical protein